MENYSSYNSFSYNTLYDNQYCMLIGNSCISTTVFSNNGVCDIYTFDDIPDPPINNTDNNGGTDNNGDDNTTDNSLSERKLYQNLHSCTCDML